MTPLYLDYNATTPIHPQVKEQIPEWLELYANPSSIHTLGRKVSAEIEKAREEILSILQLKAYQLIFTSSGTEANHTAFQFLKETKSNNKKTILISCIEHPSILNQEKIFSSYGYKVVRIPLDNNGKVSVEFIKQNLNETVALCSVMAANNETGVIQDVKTISELCKNYDTYFHCDASQIIGKAEFDFYSVDADSYTISPHKFYGLKGSAALMYRTKPKPIFYGGMQENQLRAGTENVLAILSFSKSLKLVYNNLLDSIKQQLELRNHLESSLLQFQNKIIIAGKDSERLSNTSCIMIEGILNDRTVSYLSKKGIYISKGAACHSGVWEPSTVLLSMGYPRELAECGVRISTGLFTIQEDIGRLLEEMKGL